MGEANGQLIPWKPISNHITPFILTYFCLKWGLNWVKGFSATLNPRREISPVTEFSNLFGRWKMSSRSRWKHSIVTYLILLHAFTIIESEPQDPWTFVFHLTPRPYWQAGCLLEREDKTRKLLADSGFHSDRPSSKRSEAYKNPRSVGKPPVDFWIINTHLTIKESHIDKLSRQLII